MTFPWREVFEEQCSQIGTKSTSSASLEPQGVVEFRPTEQCTNCGKLGVFIGTKLDCARLTQYGEAVFCPHCSALNTKYVFYPEFHREEFLPIMRRNVLLHPKLVTLSKGFVCPSCGGDTAKHEGSYDWSVERFVEYLYLVCMNKDCTWPGSFSENHGLY